MILRDVFLPPVEVVTPVSAIKEKERKSSYFGVCTLSTLKQWWFSEFWALASAREETLSAKFSPLVSGQLSGAQQGPPAQMTTGSG